MPNQFRRLIVSASRSPPGLDPKRIHFRNSFSLGYKKGRLLELIFALGGLFCNSFGSFFKPWEHLGSAGGQLVYHKNGLDHQRCAKRHFPKIPSLFWSHSGVFFYDFFSFLNPVFKHSFCLSSGTNFSGILALFRHHFVTVVCTCRDL